MSQPRGGQGAVVAEGLIDGGTPGLNKPTCNQEEPYLYVQMQGMNADVPSPHDAECCGGCWCSCRNFDSNSLTGSLPTELGLLTRAWKMCAHPQLS